MLVLSRCVGEAIAIGPNITVTVEEIRGWQVRIGITAPKETRIRTFTNKHSGAAKAREEETK